MRCLRRGLGPHGRRATRATRAELGKSGAELRSLDEARLRQLAPVRAALAEARDQVLGYREALVTKFGEAEPRCYAVVAVGLERILGDEVGRA